MTGDVAPLVVLLRMGEDTGLAEALRDLGLDAHVLDVGAVQQRPGDELVAEVGELSRFAWVAVTSRHAASCLGAWSAHWPSSVRVAAVGPATSDALRAAGVRCDVVSPDGTAASLAACIEDGPVLFLAGRHAREDLPVALRERGVQVRTVVAYDTTPRALDDGDRTILAAAAAVVALSPSGLDAVLDAPGGAATLEHAALIAIGPVTSRHASSRGVRIVAVAAARDAAAIADAVRAGLRGHGSPPEG